MEVSDPSAVRATVTGLRDVVGASLVAGMMFVLRTTLPAKLLMLARVMVEVAEDPA